MSRVSSSGVRLGDGVVLGDVVVMFRSPRVEKEGPTAKNSEYQDGKFKYGAIGSGFRR